MRSRKRPFKASATSNSSGQSNLFRILAFSSEVGTGSREENASKQPAKARFCFRAATARLVPACRTLEPSKCRRRRLTKHVVADTRHVVADTRGRLRATLFPSMNFLESRFCIPLSHVG